MATSNQASTIGESRPTSNNTWVIVSIGILLLLVLMTIFGGGDRARTGTAVTPGTTGATTGTVDNPGATGVNPGTGADTTTGR